MDNTELNRLHECHLRLVDELDRVCKKLGIQYFLDSGTALGAVRHGGFIPWDDDVDIGMPRADYQILITDGPKCFKDEYFLQTRETEPNYGKFAGKMRMRNTFFPDHSSVTFKERGIYIDIYPFDYVADDEKKALRDIAISRKLFRLIRLRDAKGRRKNPFMKVLSLLLQAFSKKYLDNKFERFCQKYNATPTKHMTCYSYRMASMMDLIFPTDAMFPTHNVKFEDREYQIMNDANTYLRIMYDDYMHLPPEEKRVYHLKGNINFDSNKEVK